MELFNQILEAARAYYPFTALSLSLTVLFTVIVLGVLIAGVRGFFERRRAAREIEYDDYSAPTEPRHVVVADEMIPAAPAADLPPPAEPGAIVVVVPAPPPAPAPAEDGPDDLTRLKGVGPRLAERLNTLGITRFVDLAMLSPDEARALDARLGDFMGRLERDRWIEQAQMLAIGDVAGFEKQFAPA